MAPSIVIGVILIATASSTVAGIVYVVQGNYKPLLNRLFIAMGLAQVFWAFGLAIQANGANLDIVFIGSRIAPIGYSTLFSFMLHYILILTGKQMLLRRWWSYLFIYLPGVISLVGLTILPALKIIPDTVITSPLGWVNITSNGWVNYYYLYYLAFFIASLAFLFEWRRRTASESHRKQAALMMISMLVGAVLGTTTDLVLVLLRIRMPSVGSIFAIIPILAISYSVKKFGFMQPVVVESSTIILNNKARVRVFRMLAYCIAAGSLLNILAQQILYSEAGLPSAALFSLTLFAISILILILAHQKMDEEFKEFLLAIILSVIIPLVTLRFVRYASITIWVWFMLLLLVSLMFNRRVLLLTVLISALLTQFLVWAITPRVEVTLDEADYMVRIGLLALVSAMGLFVNNIYRRRLKTNRDHTSLQTLISEVSHNLVSVDEVNLEDKLLEVITRCAKQIQSDRAGLILLDQTTSRVTEFIEWTDENPTNRNNVQAEHSIREFASHLDEFIKNPQFITSAGVAFDAKLPIGLQRLLVKMDVHSFVLLPIVKNDILFGLLFFGTRKNQTGWNKNPPSFLSIIANTIADKLANIDDTRTIEWNAYHDQLTGLPNRIHFDRNLKKAIERASQNNHLVGIAFIDLDSFKAINDTLGHEQGDQLLVGVSKAITAQLRIGDILGRFGGDEFILVIDQLATKDDVIPVVEGILSSLQKPVILQNQEFFVTGSIGIAFYPQDGSDAESVIKNADIAMYDAKKKGKNQYSICSQAIKDQATENAILSNLLYRAIEKEQLEVFYQPQVEIRTGAIVGLEALLRWKLPDQGFISPAVFIPLAEQSGLIQSIGLWVLESACRQNKKWQDAGFSSVRVAVNISVQQLENRNFVSQVSAVLEKTGLPARYLELEVTESVANSRSTNMVELLSNLKSLGISLSIDDFGTQYSSLERLKQLPVDRIKMDMEFVRGIETNEKDRAIAQVIINLAESLGMKVIAEGVETEAQHEFLMSRRCNEVQGFYFFKPMPVTDIEGILRFSRQTGSLAGKAIEREY